MNLRHVVTLVMNSQIFVHAVVMMTKTTLQVLLRRWILRHQQRSLLLVRHQVSNQVSLQVSIQISNQVSNQRIHRTRKRL